MEISEKTWKAYAGKQTQIQELAARLMREYTERAGLGSRQDLIAYAYGLATKYGEASAALAAELYDLLAEQAGKILEEAEPAATATYGEVAEAVNGVLEKSRNEEMISGAVARLVKLAGADTMLHNAGRDRAEYAWIPGGDTCAYCIALASKGWQRASASKKHAPHIHANCDCTYMIRFDKDTTVAGYDPEAYAEAYYGADLDGETPTARNRINALRREQYAENKDKINEQKREAYAKRKEQT